MKYDDLYCDDSYFRTRSMSIRSKKYRNFFLTVKYDRELLIQKILIKKTSDPKKSLPREILHSPQSCKTCGKKLERNAQLGPSSYCLHENSEVLIYAVVTFIFFEIVEGMLSLDGRV